MKFEMDANNGILTINVEKGETVKDTLAKVYETLFKKSIEENNTLGCNQGVTSLRDYLKKIGIPCHIKGYTYIQEAVNMFLSEDRNQYKESITKMLYPDIAKKCNTTSSRVERAIRHAIECAASQSYNNCLDIKTKLPNSEFLIFITEKYETMMNEKKN